MAKITPKEDAPSVITAKTTAKKSNRMMSWWKEKDEDKTAQALISTAAYLKDAQAYRQRQAAVYTRLYGNRSLFSFVGANITKIDMNSGLPTDKPTYNLVQSATDTLISRITQNRPAPTFLTDNSDYKERNLAKQLNNFILGEFYQTKTYEMAEYILKDAIVLGTGCLKVFETQDKKVGIERVLNTELLVDMNEAIKSDPRQLYQVSLVDRDVLIENFPKFKKTIEKAEKGFPDNSAESSKSVADLVIVVEGWHLPSGKDAGDGRHTIACSAGLIYDDKEWDKDRFPFVFMHYSKNFLGFWSQGLAEQIMGTQLGLNEIIWTISQAIRLVGVPRVFQENSSKVVSSHHENNVGVVVKYTGIKPSYEVAPCNAPELYAERDKLIKYAYEQCGVSQQQSAGQIPQGLESGEAQRTYDNIATDRYAALSRRYDNMFKDLAYLMTDQAMDIAKRDGKYQTIFPDKNGTKEIDLPKMDLLKNPFVIQCFNMSSIPRDPAGRAQWITERVQSGMISIREGRRLFDFQDLGQVEILANASEERIYQYLDEIVENGKYTGPDPLMDLMLAKEIVVQYYNLYVAKKLEPEKAQMLRTFYIQTLELLNAANPPQPMAGAPAPNQPQAAPMPMPQSPLVPKVQQAS